MLRAIAATLVLLAAAPALGAEVVCTGELLYTPASNPQMVIAANGMYKSMVRITHLDIETGAYSQRWFNSPDAEFQGGTLTVVSKGVANEYSEFVGVDTATGLYLRVSIGPQAMQFTRVEPEGGIQVGRCVPGDAGG